MRRAGAAIVAILTVATLVLAATPASAYQVPGPCGFARLEGETIKHYSKRRISCAVARFGPVPGGSARAICIAKRESGLDPSATSEPTGQYRGLFQHDRGMWPDRYDEYTRPTWELSPRSLNGRTNAIVTIRMVVEVGTWKAAGWPPKAC